MERLVTIRSSVHKNVVARVGADEAARRVAHEPFHYTTKSVWKKLRDKTTKV